MHYCGVHHQASIPKKVIRTEILDIGRERCKQIHESGSFVFEYRKGVMGLKSKSSTKRYFQVLGTNTRYSTCEGEKWREGETEYSNVAIQAEVFSSRTIRLTHGLVNVTPFINLRNSVTCPLKEEHF